MALSGPEWVSQFPTSKSVDDLAEPFRANVNNFIAALKAAGATVSIAATFRPPERAYLMHFCFLIAKNLIAPATVDAHPDVDIQWQHFDDAGGADLPASLAAATKMMTGYAIAFQPTLFSRHTQRLAIDMTIAWQGTLTIAPATGDPVTIASLPRSGGNVDLQQVGKSYGVIKLATDPPHWSSDGH
jgi:hypothetical protein